MLEFDIGLPIHRLDAASAIPIGLHRMHGVHKGT